jgi:two-component system, chemotaxis family, protein-glutamate methylesterase/glutaminase
MPPIRILVVDDSVVIRKVLCEALSSDPAIEVAGTAADGRIALAKITQVNPDLITLDIEMPVMNGIETLVEIRKLYPHLPVIMFSTLTERGASAALEAISLGASDYATKPSNAGSPAVAAESVRSDLIHKIKALCGRVIKAKTAPRISLPAPSRVPRPTSLGPRIDALAIGTSTGGPNALAVVLPALPADFPVPIVIVQHMPPIFTRLLAERLAGRSQIRVLEAEAGKVLEPGTAWIAPGDYHMVLKREGSAVRIALNQDPPENSCRPSVDVLFRSVAQAYGSHVLGVVMTGMGADGVRGSRQIREAGSEVIVQDEASSVVWGMPGLVAAAGQADGIYAIDLLGPEVTSRVKQSRSLLETMQGRARKEIVS